MCFGTEQVPWTAGVDVSVVFAETGEARNRECRVSYPTSKISGAQSWRMT